MTFIRTTKTFREKSCDFSEFLTDVYTLSTLLWSHTLIYIREKVEEVTRKSDYICSEIPQSHTERGCAFIRVSGIKPDLLHFALRNICVKRFSNTFPVL